LPFAFATLSSFVESRAPSTAALAVLVIVWMWRIQAGLALFATCLLLMYLLVVERSRLGILVVLVSAIAALTTLIPLWTIQGPAPVNFTDHFVYPFQLFFGEWQVAPSLAGWQGGYPLQWGAAMLLLAVATLWRWSMLAMQRGTVAAPVLLQPLGRLLSFCYTAVALLALLSFPISEPLWTLTNLQRFLTYPWQILLLAGPLVAAAAGTLPALYPVLQRSTYWAVLVLLVVLSSFPYLWADFTQVAPGSSPLAIFGANNELVILATELNEDAERGEVNLTVTWQVLHTLHFDYNIFFQALRLEGDTLQVVNQLDTQPLSGDTPATSWQPGEILTATYRLEAPGQWLATQGSEDTLRYFFGFYDWRDGARLPVDGGIDDKMVIYGN
jgi:hypothetical protein